MHTHIPVQLENKSELEASRYFGVLLMPYRMCLYIGYTQLHTLIKHATTGEPYNCGESTEVVLLNCLACLTELPHRVACPFISDFPIGQNTMVAE